VAKQQDSQVNVRNTLPHKKTTDIHHHDPTGCQGGWPNPANLLASEDLGILDQKVPWHLPVWWCLVPFCFFTPIDLLSLLVLRTFISKALLGSCLSVNDNPWQSWRGSKSWVACDPKAVQHGVSVQNMHLSTLGDPNLPHPPHCHEHTEILTHLARVGFAQPPNAPMNLSGA